MTRDLLPAVMGSGVGVGITVAVANAPWSNWTVAGVAGTFVGAMTAWAFHFLPGHLQMEQTLSELLAGERRAVAACPRPCRSGSW